MILVNITYFPGPLYFCGEIRYDVKTKIQSYEKRNLRNMSTTQRHSTKRDEILTCLRETKAHPSAAWISDRLRKQGISRATVYRTLAQLRARGEIVSVGVVDGFERFDACTKPHAHFVCTCCGAVIDVEEVSVPQSVCEQAARQLGAEVASGWLTFYGTCGDCAERK